MLKGGKEGGFYNYTKNNNLPEMPLTAVAISVETED